MSGGIFHTRGARASTQAIENYRFRQRLIPVSLLLGVSLTLASVFLLAPTSSAQDPVTTRIECSDATDDFVLLCLAFEVVFNNFVDGVVVVDLADAAKQGVIDANLAERTTDAPPCALPAPEFEDMCAEIDKAEDTTAAAVAATDAMLASLNEARTGRLTPAQHRSFDDILSSEITRIGIGIEFALLDTDGNPCRTPSDTCRMLILEVYSPSPAETAGLMVGDVIVAYGKVVADNPCRDLRSLDYDHDLGDTVSVSILRNGTAMDFDLVTAEVIDPVVFSQIVDGNVGYIQLDIFATGSPETFLAHLTRLINAGAKAIVVDLRNNPGGYLTESGLISAAFLNDGDLVYRIVSVRSDQSANAGGDGIAADAIALPMAVAVNGRSASGSELFALAMRWNSRAKIVGSTTYGKHTGQQTFAAEASDGTSLGAIQVTSLRFFGPGDLSSAGGIHPDFVESISDCAHPIGVVRQSVPSLYPQVSELSITSVPTPDPAPDPVVLEPEQIFSDISHTLFVEHIYWLAAQGITTGCGPTTFCPDESVTRGQMAAFLNRALQLPAADQDYFTDDNGSTFEDDINRLRQAGITTGCGTDMFCPDLPVTRGQMAAFLNRALQLPAADQDYFTDDNGSTFEDDINRLRQAGITTGCGTDMFCPDLPVTRGQMATFLYRARDLIEAARQQDL